MHVLYSRTASNARVLPRPLPFAADGILPLHRLGQIPCSIRSLHHPPDGTWVHHDPAAACAAASALRALARWARIILMNPPYWAYSCAPDLLRVDPTGPPVPRSPPRSLRFSPACPPVAVAVLDSTSACQPRCLPASSDPGPTVCSVLPDFASSCPSSLSASNAPLHRPPAAYPLWACCYRAGRFV